MGFIMEFAENLILKLMEDPKERDRRARERLYEVKARCDRTKEIWSYPTRPYGYWTFERHNKQIITDAMISQVPGRRNPYDDLLQQSFNNSNNEHQNNSRSNDINERDEPRRYTLTGLLSYILAENLYKKLRSP